MSVRLLFPSTLYQVNISNHQQINAEIVPTLINLKNTTPQGGDPWVGFVYNTMGTYEVHNNPLFETLCREVEKHVGRFAKELNVHRDIKFSCHQSWANIYEMHSYQESHFHPYATFSAVYYAKTTANTKIIFENPVEDMFSLQTEVQTDINKTYEIIYPKDGDLIIFRSYLRHNIPPHCDVEPRVTIAFNFK